MTLRALLAACALGAGIGAVGHAAEPVTVTVRFIDARNGKPYSRWKGPFQVSFYKADPGKVGNLRGEYDANYLGTARPVLNPNAEISFTLPNPAPGAIVLDSAVMVGCGPAFFEAKEVVEKGVVGKNECRTKFAKENGTFEAKPGEIIYFVAPLSFWEGVFH